MREYETAFLIAPTLPDEEIEALVQSMAEIVEKNAGKMENIDKWGKRRLAYPIKKFGEAYYVFFRYHSEPIVPTELDRHFKQTESVIRHMTFVQDERENVRLKKKGPGKKMRRPRQDDRPESSRYEERTSPRVKEEKADVPPPVKEKKEEASSSPKEENVEVPSPPKDEKGEDSPLPKEELADVASPLDEESEPAEPTEKEEI